MRKRMERRMDQIIQHKPTDMYTREKLKKNVEVVTTSPFEKNNGLTFSLYLEPFLNTYYQTYQNIITLNTMPCGPLSEMVTLMNTARLSTFQTSYINKSNCKYVLLRYPAESLGIRSGVCRNIDAFMGVDDIPMILGYLVSSGYKVDTSLTKMLFQSRINNNGVSETQFSGDRKLICMATFNDSPVIISDSFTQSMNDKSDSCEDINV